MPEIIGYLIKKDVYQALKLQSHIFSLVYGLFCYKKTPQILSFKNFSRGFFSLELLLMIKKAPAQRVFCRNEHLMGNFSAQTLQKESHLIHL